MKKFFKFLQCVFSRFLKYIEKKSGILGLMLSTISIVFAIIINNKSNIVLDQVGYNTNAMIEMLKAQALEILKSDKLYSDLTIEQKAIISYYNNYNNNPKSAEEWFLKGYAITAKDIGYVDDSAITECYEKAISLKPDFARALYNMGYINMQRTNYDKAIEYYEKAIRYKPDYARAYNNMGIAYQKKHDYNKAIECHERAIEIKYDYAFAYNNMGIAYQKKHDYDKAIKCYEKAIEFAPNLPEAYNNIGLAYQKRRRHDYDNAIKCYQEAIKYDPKLTQAYYNIGIAYAEGKQNLHKAIEYFYKTIEVTSHYEEAHGNTGNTYTLCENIEKVIDYCQKGARLGNEKAQQWLQWKKENGITWDI